MNRKILILVFLTVISIVSLILFYSSLSSNYSNLSATAKNVKATQADLFMSPENKCKDIETAYQKEQPDLEINCTLNSCNCHCLWIDTYHNHNITVGDQTKAVC